MRRRLVLGIISTMVVATAAIAGVVLVVDRNVSDKPEAAGFDPTGGNRSGCFADDVVTNLNAPIEGLDPTFIHSAEENRVAMAALGQLVRYDKHENIFGNLAKSWTVSDDGRRYDFTLSPGTTFSNGQTVEAEDVRASFLRLFDPKLDTSIGTFLFASQIVGLEDYVKARSSTISGIEVTDAQHVTFHLTESMPTFLYMLAMGPASILPRGTPHRKLLASEIVSSGPYVIASATPDHVRLVRRDMPKFEPLVSTIDFRFSGKNLCEDLAKGVFDIFIDRFSAAVPCATPSYAKGMFPAATIAFVAYGRTVQKSVRGTLARCADLSEYDDHLAKDTTNGMPLLGIFPGRTAASGVRHLVTAAAACKAGTKAPLELVYDTNDADVELFAKAVERGTGRKISLHRINREELNERRESGNFELMYLTFTGSFFDPSLFSGLFAGKSPFVHSSYANSELDRLSDLLRAAGDSERRRLLQEDIEAVVKADPPAIFLRQDQTSVLVSKRLDPGVANWAYSDFFGARCDTEGRAE